MARTSSNDLNKTRYTRRDYESIKDDLIAAIPSLTQEWTSREEADPGIVLIKLMSMFGDTLSYNVDKIALELYISTVTQRKNCAKILRLLGYKMHWYRSARVMAHVSLRVNQDEQGNIGHIILKPYETQFIAGNIIYTVVEQGYGSGEIDIYSNTSSTAVKLIEGTPVTVSFDKSALINNRYYFGNYNLDESEIILAIDNVANTRVSCKLTDSLYLVSSNTIIYYEFNIDEYDRPYIELCEGWEDIAGTDTATFTVTYILSAGSQGNISSNVFSSNIYNYTAENTSPSNLIITNLSNLTPYGDNGDDLESYNQPGYDPQSVTDARIDSAKYVFTHDTLVTSSDYERGCKRADDDITVSKLVDAQVVINDQLNLDDICTRALDNFSKIYVTEESMSNPGTDETVQYLLPYQVIMYLAYKNFDSQYNYYSELSSKSFWSLDPYDKDYSNTDPYSGIYWEPTFTYYGDGTTSTFELSGAKSNTHQQVNVKVTVNETEYLSDDFTYSSNIITLNDKPATVGNLVAINTETNLQEFMVASYDPSTGALTVTGSLPTKVDNIIINYDNWVTDLSSSWCKYDDTTDTIMFTKGHIPAASDIIKVTKLYSINNPTITLVAEDFGGTVPTSVTSLFINGTSVSNYDYNAPTIILTGNESYDQVTSIIVNGVPITLNDPPISNNPEELKAPGYYPYKPKDAILLSVRDMLSTLKILNVQVDFGTMKVFPFKVEGTVHLVEAVDPLEALQIIDTVNSALEQAYYPDLHPTGETPDFIEIVDIIQNADPRIKYFDAIDNIVEWAPEVQRRLSDFDEIFDTTSAIMYNGLSDNFNLSKRFMRYKFKNTAVNLSAEEETILQIEGTELGAYNLPDDYGTAYLINYSAAIDSDYIIRVLPNTYLTLQVNSISELRALCEDLTLKGYEYIRYIRHFDEAVSNRYEVDTDTIATIQNLDSITATGITEETINYTLDNDKVLLPTEEGGVPTENLIVTVTRDGVTTVTNTISDNHGFESTLDIIGDSYQLSICEVFETIVDNDTVFNTGIASEVYQVIYDGTPLIKDTDYTVSYESDIAIVTVITPLTDGKTIEIQCYLEVSDTININYEFYECDVTVTSDQYIDKILYLRSVNTTNPSSNYGYLQDIIVDDITYYLEEPTAGEISTEHNSNLLADFNEGTYEIDSQISTTYRFRFNQVPSYVYFYLQAYTDQIDSGQTVVSPDFYVEKSTLINNTGLQWIKED